MRSAQNSSQSKSGSAVYLLRSLLIISILAAVAALIAAAAGGLGQQYFVPLGSFLALAIISLIFLLNGIFLPAQILLPASLFVVITYVITTPPGYGLHDINLIAYAMVISLAGLTLGQTGAFTFTILIILAVFGIGNAEMRGILVSQTSSLTVPISPVVISIIILAITFIQRTRINLVNENEQRTRASEKEAIERNEELRSLSAGLEKTIKARTAELELANQHNERRAKQFEAISQVSRAINQTQGLQDLLPQITQVISQQFSFYHVGIFLLDKNNEYAMLAAANSEGGQKMLARDHKLKVGQVGIVGNVAKTGIPRIALDTGADAIYFNNPDLPETHSEMALPLFMGERQLIGVMDVQSTEQNAFRQEDIQILATLADQVSVAIANARLYEDTQKSLLESEMFYRHDIQTGWTKFTHAQKIAGIHRQGMRSNLYTKSIKLDGEEEVIHSKTRYINKNNSQMTVPVKLRGQIVGMLNVKTDEKREWAGDEMDIITAIVERAALSIENARLLAESRTAAEKERVIGEISAKISASTKIETILKTAVRELGNQINDAQISVEIESSDEQ
jgi:GAF domain-containing protein